MFRVVATSRDRRLGRPRRGGVATRSHPRGPRRTAHYHAQVIHLQTDLELSRADAETVLAAWLGGPVACTRIRSLKGGLVNTVLELGFDRSPHRAVIKLHASGSDTFEREAAALDHLRDTTACPSPRVYLQDGSTRLIPHAFLLLEAMPGVGLDGLDLPPSERADIEAQLADVLAELHGHTRASYGFIDARADEEGWGERFAGRLRSARGYPGLEERLSATVLAQVDAAIAGAEAALKDAGPPTLIHGDVWEGNMIVRREDGRWRLTGLVDPALEYADVELELAYLDVFDKPRTAFFDAYVARRPPRPGYERRRRYYWLHTGLVHVALFGDPFFCEYTARIAAEIDDAASTTGAPA